MISKLSLCADVLTILFFTLGIGYAIYEMIQERNQPEDAPVHSVRAIGRTDKNGRPVYEGDVIVYEIVFRKKKIFVKNQRSYGMMKFVGLCARILTIRKIVSRSRRRRILTKISK